MKVLALFLALVITLVATEESKPTPKMPEEIALASGRVLRKVTVIRWEKERVVLKYAGGVDPIRFDAMTPTSRAAVEAFRVEEETPRMFRGEIFIVTKGAENIKLGNVPVYILPGKKPSAEQIVSPVGVATMPRCETIVRSSSDGKFEFKWPRSQPFTLCVYATRLVGGREYYLWLLELSEIQDQTNIQLSNANMVRSGYMGPH